MLSALGGETVQLTPGTDLAQTKSTVIVAERPLHEVMERIAKVYGAEWKELSASPLRMELRRTKEVNDWHKLWISTRKEAERRAREIQEDFVRRKLAEGLSALDAAPVLNEKGRRTFPPVIVNETLSRFIKSLGEADIELLVRHIASTSAMRAGADLSRSPAPVTKAFRDFRPDQQRLLREWLRDEVGEAVSPTFQRYLDGLKDSVLEIGSTDGMAIDIFFHTPNGDRFSSTAIGYSYVPEKMEEFLHKEQFRLLSKHKTPMGALLGAAPLADGTVSPLVSFQDPALSKRPMPKAPSPPLESEFLALLADQLKVGVVADHYTRSARLRQVTGQSVEDLAVAAMKAYQSVAQQEGHYLLVRNWAWPDRDEEEIPGTQAEKWIAGKTRGEGLTFDELALINRFTERQIDGLGAYFDGPISFGPEIGIVRRHRWIVALLDALPEPQRAATRTKKGLPLRSMSLKHRNFLLRSVPNIGNAERLSLYLEDQASTFVRGVRNYRAYLFEPGSQTPVWVSN